MKNKTQKIYCNVPVYAARGFNRDANLPSKQKYTLFITYPIHNTAQFIFNTGKGMGSFGIIKEIGKAYKKIYSDPDKYGIWGHCIEDLVIEAIYIDYEKQEIKLFVGS